LDGSGNLFIADTDNSRIRRVDAATGIITTVAGNGTAGFSGDGGRATTATLNSPFGITINGSSNLFVADTGNNRIRRVDGSTGIITTVAGNGSRGFGGDGGPATSAMLNFPLGVAVDRANNLLIADTANNRVRGVRGSTGIITTVAGNGSLGFSGDGGPAVNATLNGLQAAVVDLSGNLFIADTFSNRVRRVQLLPTVSLSSTSLSFGGQTVGTPSLQQTVTLSNVGFAPLTITSILAFGDFFQFNNCFPGVASQANCVINVIFLPTAVGTRTGTITITDNAPGSPHVISLSGTGTLPAPIQALSVSAHTLSFSTPLGTVSPPQRIILSNIGSADVIVSGPILTNSAFVISAESCSFIVLGPGAICAVDVQFVGRPAHVSGSLVFSDDAVVSPSVHLIGSAF